MEFIVDDNGSYTIILLETTGGTSSIYTEVSGVAEIRADVEIRGDLEIRISEIDGDLQVDGFADFHKMFVF